MSSPLQAISHEEIERLEAIGRADAAPDGSQLVVVGGLATLLFLLQGYVEQQDLLASAASWWWQPVLLVAWIASTLRRGALTVGGARSTESTAYRVAFASSGACLLIFLIANATRGEVDGYGAALLLCALLGTSFSMLASLASLRWMWVFAAGWFMLLGMFAWRGGLVLSDYLVLAAASVALLLLPGILLVLRKRRLVPAIRNP